MWQCYISNSTWWNADTDPCISVANPRTAFANASAQVGSMLVSGLWEKMTTWSVLSTSLDLTQSLELALLPRLAHGRP